MDRNKKLAAAMAAVSAYLDSEQQSEPMRTQAWNRAGRLNQIQQRKMVLQRSVMKFAAYR